MADPIFAAIEAHREHWKAYAAILQRNGRWTRLGSKNDAIRTAARELYWGQTDALLETVPTSLAGLLALARYTSDFDHEQDGAVPMPCAMATVVACLTGVRAQQLAAA